MSAGEEQLAQARRALNDITLGSAGRRATELNLPGALEELHAWLRDDREAGSVFAAHWATLLEDVLWAVGQCGPQLSAALVGGDEGVLDEIRACRLTLKSVRGAPDRAMRRRTAAVSDKLTAQMSTGAVLRAAFDDIVLASSPEVAEGAARLFVALCRDAGHDERWFPQRIGSILGDDAFVVAIARGEQAPEDHRSPAGSTPEERLALVDDLVQRPPRRSEAVVWLQFAHAQLGWPPTLTLGDKVTLFDDHWLRSVLQHDPKQLSDLAPDAASDEDGFDVRLFVGEDEDEPSEDAGRTVFARVVVPNATAAEAKHIARRTADAIAGVASLHGTRPRLWELDDSYVVRTEDGSGGSAFGAPPAAGLDVDDEIALANDQTGQQLARMGEMLGRHLPVTDHAILEAATLLSWLRSARAAPAAPRVVLCGRVVEQVTGWAGFGEPRRFTTEILRPAWVVMRLSNAVAAGAFAANDELRRRGASNLAETFGEYVGDGGVTVHLQRFLESFEQVLEALGDNSQSANRVHVLRPHLRNSSTSAAWFKSATVEFDRLEARRLRTRNSLVHGGPIAPRTIEGVVEFAEALATIALGDCIEGRLSDMDLVDYFLERRVKRSEVHRRLLGGEPLSQALFWEEAE